MDKEYVLITGAYGGLGTALAHEFSKAGFSLVLLGRDLSKLEALATSLSSEVTIISSDVSDWDSCQLAFDTIKSLGISIKILINNAGISYIQKFDTNFDIKKYQQVMRTNLDGTIFITKLFLEDVLKNKGSIINISSVIGYAPVIGRTAYAASKFGMEGFFSVLKAECEDTLHIMMVYPTFIATNIRKHITGKHEVNEILTPEKVAQSIYNGFVKKRSKLYLGKTAKLSKLMYHYFPKMYVNLMRKKISKNN